MLRKNLLLVAMTALLGSSFLLIGVSLFRLQEYKRYIVYMRLPRCLEWDVRYDQIFKPNCKETFRLSDRVVDFQTNEMGLRDRAVSQIKPEQVFVVGDSVVEVMGLQYSESFSQVLEKETADELGLQFINLGRRRSSPVTQVLGLRAKIEKLKPKYIIWALTENDFNDDYFAKERATEIGSNGLPIKFDIQYLKNTEPNLLKDFIFNLDPGSSDSLAILKYIYLSKFVFKTYEKWENAPADCSGIHEAERIAREMNIKLGFMAVPFSPKYVSLYREGNLKLQLQKLIECTSHPVFDLRVPSISRDEHFYQEDLMHFNAEGVRKSVQYLKRQIIEFIQN
ncbi:MAG: hypothetical protein JNJ49_00220 [Bdellovibrionaceae bacterium]|nr:hypothetical protein [Pseudobdellovibrionaceae bacterium]